ncbi:MAG: calcium-translocating P-type ATPase, PMCA-type [Clostridia bacterium]|nr:calcium-translocating P-type ATPase, PMCA-type [Clostridia bacterium]
MQTDIKWCSLSAESTIKQLKSDSEKGLSAAQVSINKSVYENNVLVQKGRKNVFIRFLEQFKDLMVIILITAAIVSAVASYISGDNDIIDPIIILSIVIINALMGVIQESRAEKAIDALKKLSAPTSTVIRNGKTSKIPSAELLPGDIILLNAGDMIPADARLIHTYSLTVEESSLTGESTPVEKYPHIVFEENTIISEQKNMVFANSVVLSGSCKAIVVETGMNTQVGKIAEMLNNQTTPPTPLQNRLSKTGKALGLGAVLICIVLFILGTAQSIPPLENLMIAVSLAVAAIPEGLTAIVTIVLAIGVQRMAKSNAIIRRLPAVETLGSATVICSDKTGTLTQNKMTVTTVATASGKQDLNSNRAKKILLLGSICNNSSKDTRSENPTEAAILTAYERQFKDEEFKKYIKILEIPFNSKLKKMTTLHRINDDFIVISKGAIERILPVCNQYYDDGGEIRDLSESMRHRIEGINDDLAKSALRVIAVAYKNYPEKPATDSIENSLVFVGLIGIIDPPRPEAIEAVAVCKKAGIKPVMITGDHALTAEAIARELNICDKNGKAIQGVDIDTMTQNELEERVRNCNVFARVSPEHKVRIVKAFQANGDVVAMTGDGINDAPALKAADIGCAMGKGGTQVAKNAADMVLTDDNFSTIVCAVSEGRGIFDNIKKAAHFLISSNIGEIIVIFISILLGHPTPLLPIQLLWINLVTDSLPAMALGVEPSEKNIMNRKPKDSKDGLFDKSTVVNIALEGGLIGSLALFAFMFGQFMFGNSGINVARTMAFSVLGLSQLIHAFNMRSEQSLFKIGIFSNKKMIQSFLVCLILQISVVSFPALTGIFKTTQLNIDQWLIVTVLALVPLIIVEIEKAIINRKKR